MSKLLGKLLIESGAYDKEEFCSYACFVKYVVSGDYFLFNLRENEQTYKNAISFKVSAAVCECLVDADDDSNEWLFSFSAGYKVRPKRGLNQIKGLRSDELDWICRRVVDVDENVIVAGSGRKLLILNGFLDDDYCFDTLCVLFYLFKFSKGMFTNIKTQWKRKKWGKSSDRWILVPLKTNVGRKKGALSKRKQEGREFEETDSEFEERIAHNKKVAIMKGYLGWYLDACREECKRRGVRFDKKLWVSVWNVERANVKGDESL